MKVMKLGSTGDLVSRWQYFLRGQEYPVNVTGYFDQETHEATRDFQMKHALDVDGVVGNQTLGKAAQLGFQIVEYEAADNPAYPAPPNFPPLIGEAQRQALFGPLVAVPAPTPSNKEAIRITNSFEHDKIVNVLIPQLAGISGAPAGNKVRFHVRAAQQLTQLWQAWDDAGLISKILTFDGAYNPRYVRGLAAKQVLSNHAFGTAFDINAAWNAYGAQPATANQKGCVYSLVQIANQYGFYWGGHFSSKKDGMHFEVAQLHS